MVANNIETIKKEKPAQTYGFKPGKSGNPSGSPKVPKEFKEFAKIKLTKMLLLLTEKELLDCIPTSLLETALRRGKGYLRNEKYENRMAKKIM